MHGAQYESLRYKCMLCRSAFEEQDAAAFKKSVEKWASKGKVWAINTLRNMKEHPDLDPTDQAAHSKYTNKRLLECTGKKCGDPKCDCKQSNKPLYRVREPVGLIFMGITARALSNKSGGLAKNGIGVSLIYSFYFFHISYTL